MALQGDQVSLRITELIGSVLYLSPTDMEHQLRLNEKIVQSILHSDLLAKLPQLHLLKLILYEVIIFASEEITSSPTDGSKTVRITHKRNKKHSGNNTSSDSEGNEVLIEQLEDILMKKEDRIKELNKELEDNFSQQKDLEEKIEEYEVENENLCSIIEELNQKIDELEGNAVEGAHQVIKSKIGKKDNKKGSLPLEPVKKLFEEDNDELLLEGQILKKTYEQEDAFQTMLVQKPEERTAKKVPTINKEKQRMEVLQCKEGSIERMLFTQALVIEQLLLND